MASWMVASAGCDRRWKAVSVMRRSIVYVRARYGRDLGVEKRKKGVGLEHAGLGYGPWAV